MIRKLDTWEKLIVRYHAFLNNQPVLENPDTGEKEPRRLTTKEFAEVLGVGVDWIYRMKRGELPDRTLKETIMVHMGESKFFHFLKEQGVDYDC